VTTRSWNRRLFGRTSRTARKCPGGVAPTLSARGVGLTGRDQIRPADPRKKVGPCGPRASLVRI
jgi:hypothetical protein